MIKIGRMKQGGVTLIELVMALLIFGILAATAVTALTGKERAAISEADQFRRHIAHVQMLATSWGVGLRLATFADGSGYAVTCLSAASGTPCSAAGDQPVDPATGSKFVVTLESGVLIAPAGSAVDFDSMGRPWSSGVLIAAAKVYTLSGGTAISEVKLQPITGFAAS